jgi:hypothetical protein
LRIFGDLDKLRAMGPFLISAVQVAHGGRHDAGSVTSVRC